MIKRVFLKEVGILLIFILVVCISQAIILKPHLQFGFSPDDVRLISDYISLGSNPLLKFPQVWQSLGPHVINPLYYDGVLFNFFGFDYQGYQIASLIFKILSIVTFYILIQTIFRKSLLSFISGLIFSFHYGSAGSLEMVARTQDYLVITGINIFFIFFYLIHTQRIKNILWLFLSSIILFCTFFINPIRAFPILPFIFFMELLIFFKRGPLFNFYQLAKRVSIIIFPFILLFILGGGHSQVNLGALAEITQRASLGNLQILLTPLTTLGSLFLTGDGLKFLSLSTWNFNDYLIYLIEGPLIIFGFTTIIISRILSKTSSKFLFSVLFTNFIFELIIFFMVNQGFNLPDKIRMHYDIALIPPAILGAYIISVTIFIFKEWISNVENTHLTLYVLGISFAIIFIYFTWFFQDYVFVPMGINGYSTIPSMGISAAIGSILVSIYNKLKNRKNIFKYLAPLVFLTLIPYFLLSNTQIQTYLQKNLDNGMNAKDQLYMKDRFWSFVDIPTSCDKFFFLDTKGDYDNGYFYSFILIDRFEKWYNLYGPYHSKKNCPVAFLVSDEVALKKSYTSVNEKEGFIYKDTNGKEGFFPLKNFYALKFHNKDVLNIKEDVLQKIK